MCSLHPVCRWWLWWLRGWSHRPVPWTLSALHSTSEASSQLSFYPEWVFLPSSCLVSGGEGEGTVATPSRHLCLASGRGVVGGRERQHRAASEVSISIVFFLWGISRLSRPELPIDRVETDSVLVPKEQSADPHRAWGMARADGAAQSITCVSVWASRPSRLSCDLSAPWRSPWIVDSLLTVSVVCLSTTLFMDTGVGISYHFHMP